jgi:hypothetical protein
MFFWVGSDRERVGEAECNLMLDTEVANVYYRSAASWKTAIGADALVFYDDNANGNAVRHRGVRATLQGRRARRPTPATALRCPCSTRCGSARGRGCRTRSSSSCRPAGSTCAALDKETVGLRPLNPEYFKTGKIKLVWNGPKPSAPAQLVVQGAGDFKTAFFDVAGGKEVEVPAGNYTVILGRIVVGKGARAQLATIYQGSSAAFTVEAGKTELKMGAPFTLQFERGGDENATIDA